MNWNKQDPAEQTDDAQLESDAEPEPVEGEQPGRSYDSTQDIAADTDTHEPSPPQSVEFEQCIDLIQRVRETIPECLADLQASEAESMWLSGEDDLPPQIGRFQIVSKLGEGGFGLVFLAIDPDLEREVALKVPRVETLVTESTRQRFLKEGRAAARLGHPQIATVFESGRIGPICFIAAEHCAGGSLAEWLQRRVERSPDSRLSPRHAASLIQRLAEAVHYSHQRGILHRDLKPSNVLLASAEEADDASLASESRIVDFGLAKCLEDESDRTRTGAILGTPRYMSPEQTLGKIDEIGPACDVYSLGAILYELLTGGAPFADVSDALLPSAVATQDPSPPRRFEPGCPRDLEAICLKCLEKQPARRYATAAELVADLERFLDGEPVRARRITSLQRASRWCVRNPVPAILSAAFTVSLLALAIVSTLGYWRTSLALQERNTALKRVEERNAAVEQRFELAQEAVGDFLVATADDEQLKSEALHRLRRDLLERAQGFFEKLVAMEEGERSDLQSAYGLAVWRLAVLNRQLGDYEAAIEAHQESIKIFEELVERQPDDVVVLNRLGRGYIDFGLLYFRQNDRNKAEPQWRKSAEIYERINKIGTGSSSVTESVLQNTGTSIEYLGMLHAMEQKHDEAESYYQESLAVRLALALKYGRSPSNSGPLANSYTNLGYLDKTRGDIPAAVEHWQDAVDVLREALLEHPEDERLRMDLAKALGLVAAMLKIQKDFEGAHQRLDESNLILSKLCEDQPLTPLYKIRLAMQLSDMSIDSQRSEEERVRHRQHARDLLLQVRRQHPQQRVAYVLPYSIHMNEAVHLKKKGRTEEAVEELALAIEVCDTELAFDPKGILPQVNRAKATFFVGHYHRKDEDPSLAMKSYDAAVEQLVPLLKKSPDLAEAKTWLGFTYVDRAKIYDRLKKPELAHQDRMAAAELGQEFNHKDTIYALTRDLAKAPNDAKLLVKRAWRWWQRGDYDEAAEDCTRAIDAKPKRLVDRLYAQDMRGWVHVYRYRFDAAARDFEEVIALKDEPLSETFRVLAWLAVIGEAPTASLGRAEQHAERALQTAKTDDEQVLSLSTLGIVRFRQRRYQEALDTFAKIETVAPHFESLFYQALCHHALGDAKAAAKCFEWACCWPEHHESRNGEPVEMARYLSRLEATVAQRLSREPKSEVALLHEVE